MTRKVIWISPLTTCRKNKAIRLDPACVRKIRLGAMTPVKAASFGRRVAAFAIDAAVIGGLYVLLFGVVVRMQLGGNGPSTL